MKNTLAAIFILSGTLLSAQEPGLNIRVKNIVNKLTEERFLTYTDLHRNPELSLMEKRTSAKMAEELKKLGFEVTAGIGGNGIIGIFRNGPGKTIMLRTDMDALPVKETTGLLYASTVIMKDASGKESNVMHACGHDFHMTTWLGTLETLVALRKEWSGTLMAVAQPGEEGSFGARMMLNDGLYKRFAVPDYALAFHVSAELPAGTIGYHAGPMFAGVNTTEVTVYGIGGHGAMPHLTIDPVVLSARIILDLQTIVSREISPVKPAVITVGSIHGGTRSNIIPDEVRLQLTIRYFEDDVLMKIKESILNKTMGAAMAAGLPVEKAPVVNFDPAVNPPVTNNPGLVGKVVLFMTDILGDSNMRAVEPAMVAEDFGKYGLTAEKVPVAIFWLGGVSRQEYEDHMKKGTPLSPLHSSAFSPDFRPAFETGVAAMARSVIGLLAK